MSWTMNDTTLTPLALIKSLGKFDLDPCGFIGHKTAKKIIRLPEDGLLAKWSGRVWLNPPYSSPTQWLTKMIQNGNGIALLLASTETNWFQHYVWERADAIFFLKGRPKFLRKDKTEVQLMRATVLVAYGLKNRNALRNCGLEGKYIEL